MIDAIEQWLIKWGLEFWGIFGKTPSCEEEAEVMGAAFALALMIAFFLAAMCLEATWISKRTKKRRIRAREEKAKGYKTIE